MKLKPAILVVDDSPELLRMMVTLLQRAGCEVAGAATAEQGLALALAGHFDLAVLDIDLPGMTGFELCRCLKETPGRDPLPVIFVSGRSSADDRQQGLALGAADYIEKPFEAPLFAGRVLACAQVGRASHPSPLAV